MILSRPGVDEEKVPLRLLVRLVRTDEIGLPAVRPVDARQRY
jgi:hypothetical protein